MNPITFSVAALDCPDPIALARFYADLTGLEVEQLGDFPPEDVEWIELLNNGLPTIGFQKVPAHVPPDWPDGSPPQQLHLDFKVADLDEGEAHALRVGARKVANQPGTSWRVYLDPAGHPFCLVKSES